MTPAEKLGFKIGKQYRVKSAENSSYYAVDMIVEFCKDDKTSCPLFKIISGPPAMNITPDNKVYIDLDDLEEIQQEYSQSITHMVGNWYKHTISGVYHMIINIEGIVALVDTSGRAWSDSVRAKGTHISEELFKIICAGKSEQFTLVENINIVQC